MTHQFVEAAGPAGAKILDTRKTTPGLRKFEKAAVVAGGGTNHRFGLFDMVLVKDNHLLARNGLARLSAAIERMRQERPDLEIEVEADNLDQVRALLEIEGVEVILLDNMRGTAMREAVAIGKGKVKFEASGGVNLAQHSPNRRDRSRFRVDWRAHPFRSRDRFFAGAQACLRLIDWSRASFANR